MKLKLIILRLLLVIPDSLFNRILFFIKLKYIPHFKNPRSFNEKINHIKLYSNYYLREIVADRLKVRDYVVNKKTECQLIDLLWIGKDFTKDVYDSLPRKFVIKANHGSGMVKIVDKEQITFEKLSSEIENWLKFDYGKLTRQWVYQNLEKKFIVEKFIEYKDGDLPDYKFFCFNGKVELIQVDLDRFHGHKRNLYDRDFNLLNVRLLYENGERIKQPALLFKAIEISEKLSEEFDFIRVDLYILDDKVYFGEMTNTPENGMGRFIPKEFDFKLGEKLVFDKEF